MPNGITLDDIKVDSTTSGEAANQLADGTIDAAFFAGGAPLAAIMDIATKKPITLLSATPEAMAKIEQENPDLFRYDIKGGTYNGRDTDAVAVSNMAVLVARPDLSEYLIYEITKLMFEQIDDFKTGHKSLSSFKIENAMSQEKLAPFHPGALKYYKEKGIAK